MFTTSGGRQPPTRSPSASLADSNVAALRQHLEGLELSARKQGKKLVLASASKSGEVISAISDAAARGATAPNVPASPMLKLPRRAACSVMAHASSRNEQCFCAAKSECLVKPLRRACQTAPRSALTTYSALAVEPTAHLTLLHRLPMAALRLSRFLLTAACSQRAQQLSRQQNL